MQKNVFIYWLLAFLFRSLIAASFIHITLIKEIEQVDFPALYIANHQSAADIIIMGYLQGVHPHFWFYWDRFSKTPILSCFTTRLGLSIKQNSSHHDARTLLRGIALMREYSCNAVLFPEGGRFNDGVVHPFECGFVLLSRKAGVPIIPVYIKNLGKVYPPKSFLIYNYPVTVIVGASLSKTDDESDSDFCNRVHEWFDNYNAV